MNNENSELLNKYLNYLKSLNYSESTVLIRSTSVQAFLKFSPETSFKDLTEADIYSFIKSLDYMKGNSRDTRLGSLTLFFEYLESHFYIFSNPMADIKLKATKRGVPQVLSTVEIEQVLDSINTSSKAGNRNRAFLELAYSTGARRSEVLNIKLNDLYLNDHLVRIMGKGKKERIVPFGQQAYSWLTKYLDMTSPRQGQDLWLSREGNKMNSQSIDYLFREIRKKTSLECSCHTLRRSCASHLLQNGMNPVMIAELLGHEDLSKLKYYLLTDIKDLKKSQKLIDGKK